MRLIELTPGSLRLRRAVCDRANRLDVELDLDTLTDDDDAGLDDLVPLEAEVSAIDRRLMEMSLRLLRRPD